MKVALYTVHYGKEYLAYSIRSIQDAVDTILVHYSPSPSFGHSNGSTNPDTEEELYEQAHRFATKPIIWKRDQWNSEHEHRNAALEDAKKLHAEVALVVDADEIWDPEAAKFSVDHVYAENKAGRWSASFANFWRSFDWMVVDHFTPIRFVDFRHNISSLEHLHAQPKPIYHFGYAQSLALMRYKWTCHGHQAELRTGWWEKFAAWAPGNQLEDLHPAVNNLWPSAVETPNTVKTIVDKILHDHPYLNLPLII